MFYLKWKVILLDTFNLFAKIYNMNTYLNKKLSINWIDSFFDFCFIESMLAYFSQTNKFPD